MDHKKASWYRPEIDGLRALAVIPVILFHANIAGFAGGYIGVDIFFVISGFLITSIIYRDLQRGTFSFLTFWERRMRRIIPALFVVVMCSLVAGYFVILFPIDYIDLGQSALAQAAFLANIFFMRNNGYFAGPSEYMPLLHTWSLSVEEQFYIGFPILCFLLWRYAKRALLPVLITLGVLSLAYSYYLLSLAPGDNFSFPIGPNIWSETRNVTAAFYFLPSRAFELIIGALLALTTFAITNKRWAEVLALLGLGLIIFSIVTFDRTTAFPGLYALVPTLGTAAIILANTHVKTFVGNLLSFPLFVWVGLISYSLYLWHWPLIVFGRHYDGNFVLTPMETIIILLLSFIAAYLSYRFVETPFRLKQLLVTRRSMLLGGIAALLVMIGSGWVLIDQKGFPERLTGTAAAIAAANVDFNERRSECFVNSFETNNNPCLIGEKDTDDVTFVVWGDSHAASLLSLLSGLATESNRTGATFITPACLPIANTLTDPPTEKCQQVKNYAYNYILENNITDVFLIARWTGYAELIDPTTPDAQADEEIARQLFATSLTTMIETLTTAGIHVHIIKQVPQHLDYRARELIYQTALANEEVALPAITYSEHATNLAFPNQIFSQLANVPDVRVIDPGVLLCPDFGSCLLEQDGVILYENSDHINKTGSLLLKPLFNELFQ